MAAEFAALRRNGAARITVLIADNHASRLAHRMARALLRPGDALELVTVVSSAGARAYGDALLAPYLAQHAAVSTGGGSGAGGGGPQQQQQQQPGHSTIGTTNTVAVTGTVLEKGDARLADVIEAHLSASRADLCVVGSHQLAATGARDDPIPASGSFALRLARALRACPLLVVNINASGHYLKSGTAGAGLRVMVDVRPDSRHFLEYVMGRLEPGQDGLFLAARPGGGGGFGGGGGYGSDGGGGAWAASDTLRRMMSVFCTQAGAGGFYAAQRPMKDASIAGLVAAAKADAIDIVALHAPPCRVLPDHIVEALKTARAGVLVYRAPPAAAAVTGSAAGLAQQQQQQEEDAGFERRAGSGEWLTRDDGGDQQR